MADQWNQQAELGISDGDPIQWRRLLNELIPKLYRMFMERWPNASFVEELVQKTVFDAVRGRQGYDPARGCPENWIFGIAYNNIRLELRKRASRPAVNGDITKYLEVMDTQLLPDEALEQKETTERVRTTLNMLNEREQAVLRDRYLKDLSIRDIAKQMNITEKAVYSLLYRAGVSFRQQLLRSTLEAAQGDNYGH